MADHDFTEIEIKERESAVPGNHLRAGRYVFL